MVPANGAALAVAVVAVAFAAAEECADSCGMIDGNHAKTMNTLACKGLSNYPHKELDACRKGFKVAHTMACFFVCEAMSPAELPPRDDVSQVASREAACKKTVDAEQDETVKPWIRRECLRGYDFGVAQYVLAHPTVAGDGAKTARSFHPNTWTFVAARRAKLGERLRALFACLHGANRIISGQLACFSLELQTSSFKGDATAYAWLSQPELYAGTPVEKAARAHSDVLQIHRSPATVRAGCVVLSVGVEDDLAFERSVLATTPCRVLALDPREGVGAGLADNALFHLEPLAVGSKDGNITLSFKYSKPKPFAPQTYRAAKFATALGQLHEASAQGLSARDLSMVKIDAPGSEFAILTDVLRLGTVPLVRVDLHASDAWKLSAMMHDIVEAGYDIAFVHKAEKVVHPWQEVGFVVSKPEALVLRVTLLKMPTEATAKELGGAMTSARQLLAAAVVKKAATVAAPLGDAQP